MSASSDSPAPVASCAVVWERLVLEGFGRHRRLEAAFSGGLETWVGDNETGKSTALMGLLATVWGLPHVQDPGVLGWARFRAWSGGPHRGQLTLRGRDGRRYTVTREFERHQVRVVAHGEGGDEVVLDAVHNPNARKETSPYEPWLASALGVTDLALVLETFVVAQGDGAAAPHRLQHDVQALVSGAGGGSYRVALERLADALRTRTRTLRPLGIGLADGRNDRALEELEADIAAKTEAMVAGRLAADGMRAAQVDLARAEEAYVEAKQESRRLRETVRAQASWVDRREAARREARRLTDVRRALTRASELERAVHEAEADLAATWPAFAGAPDETEAHLEAFASARRRLAEVEARVVEAEEDLEARRREAEASLSALEAAEHAAAADEDDAVVDPFTAPRSWDALGVPAGDAIRRMRRAATALTRQVRTVAAGRDRLLEAQEEFDPIDVFAGIGDATRELLEEYAPRGRVLAEDIVRTRTRRDELLERMRRHEAAFARVRSLEEGDVEALQAFDAAWEARRDPWPWRFAAALAGGVVGWFGVPWAVELVTATPPAWSALIGAGIMATAAAALVPNGDDTGPARSTLAERGIDGDDEALRQLLRQREAYEAQRDQVEDDAAALEAAREDAAAAEADGIMFRDAVAPLLAALPEGADPGEAYARWKLLAPRVAREREALLAQVGYLTEAPIEELDTATAATAGETVIELARLAAFQGVVDVDLEEAGDGVTLLELAAWLERVSEASWDHWQRAADEHDRSRDERFEAAREHLAARTRWAERIADAEAALERARQALAQVARDEAKATAALSWLWGRLATGPDGSDSGEGDDDDEDGLIGDEEISDGALRGLDDDARVGAAAPWDPQMLRQGWDERRRAGEEAAAQRRELRAHLAAYGAGGVADLEQAAQAAAVAAGAALTAWQDLVRAHPDLPSVDLDSDAAVEERFRSVEAAASAAADAERRANDAVLEAQRALARSQGAAVVNLAATSLAIEEAEDAAARVREEIVTLTLAYRELTAAVEDFRRDHRQRLEERSSAYLARFAGVAGRRVVLGDEFAASVREPSGDIAVPAQLSQGARDQLALSLRLAVADLVGDDVALPLVFDDPFLHWDADRLVRVREALTTLATDRQVLVFSHRPSVAAWGAPVQRSGGGQD